MDTAEGFPALYDTSRGGHRDAGLLHNIWTTVADRMAVEGVDGKLLNDDSSSWVPLISRAHCCCVLHQTNNNTIVNVHG